jgi:hypothetical protein
MFKVGRSLDGTFKIVTNPAKAENVNINSINN